MSSFSDKRRTRTVNFRLSPEEFEQLKRACSAEGARSLSDFARMAVSRLSAGGRQAPGGGDGLDRRLERIERQLADLAELLRARRSMAAGASGDVA
jgi:hypothetical protein